MKAHKHALAALLFASFAFPAVAQQEQVSGDWTWTMSLSNLTIDSDAADNNRVDDSGLAIGFYGDFQMNSWLTTIGAEVVVYDDNDGFSQEVVGTGAFNNGDRSRASSDATGVVLSVATGYQWFFGENDNISAALQGGFGAMVSSSREIANCSNCYSEDINIDGGAFAKASLIRNGESWRVGGFVQQYLSGDLGTAIGIQIGSSF